MSEPRDGNAVGSLVAGALRLLVRPVRDLAGSNGIDVPHRLETAAVNVAATATAENAADGILAGPLPESIGRSLGEHRVIERVVAEAVASTDLEQALISALESERTTHLVETVVASQALERLVMDAFESKLTLELTDRILRSPQLEQVLEQVFSSPQVRRALARQTTSLADETVDAARRRASRADDAAERAPRRWLRRAPRVPAGGDGVVQPVPYAGIGTRAFGLAVDTGLLLLTFLTLSALVGLIGSLVDLRPGWLVATVGAAGWLLLQVLYFVGFWTTAGQTPGMRLMRLRVRDGANRPPGFWRSLLRLVGLALAIIPCFAGFLPVLVDDRRRGLHDFVAGTVVVYDDPAL